MTDIPPRLKKALISGKQVAANLFDIKILEEMQPRDSVRKGPPDGLTRATIKKYANLIMAEGPKALPPITVAYIQDIGIVVVDGWHRYHAHIDAREKQIQITIREMTLEEAKWEAVKANQTHGRPMATKDYREMFRRYILAKDHLNEERNPKSYREMASDLGHIKAHTTIRNWVEQDFPKLFNALKSDDEEYTDEDMDPETLHRWRVEEAQRYADTAFYKAYENLSSLKRLEPELANSIVASQLNTLADFINLPVDQLPEWLSSFRLKEEQERERADF